MSKRESSNSQGTIITLGALRCTTRWAGDTRAVTLRRSKGSEEGNNDCSLEILHLEDLCFVGEVLVFGVLLVGTSFFCELLDW